MSTTVASLPVPARGAYGLFGRASHLLPDLLPGLLLCGVLAGVATVLQAGETQLFGRAWLEALVLAILVGTALRTVWTPGPRFRAGIEFSARTVLEVAVLLLGASVSAQAIMAIGVGMLGGIAGIVIAAIGASYGIGRLLGLPHRMATLVACGNSICGNSAIAAVAPAIGARPADVAAAIAFTAVLGVVVVLALPFAAPLLHLSELQYGALAGLTVYAVPQVLAATAPVGPVALQIGTLVKLVRVLMLGPVVLCLSLANRQGSARLSLFKLVPWFIIGFLGLAAAHSAGLLPDAVQRVAAPCANILTVVAMAALGISTDLRVVAGAGMRVTCAVTLSLVVLGAMSLALIRLLGVA